MLFLSALLNAAEENCVNTVYRLRDCLHLPVTTATIKTQLKEHPNYPSLLSISDALNSWKVENLSAKITKAKLSELPTPFITQLRRDGQEYFVVAREMKEQAIVVSDIVSKQWRKVGITEFEKQWTGIVMLVAPLEGAGEKEYKKNKASQLVLKSTRGFSVVLILFLWLALSISTFYQSGVQALAPVALLTLKILGSYIGILLLWYEIDQHNPVLQKVCGASSGGKTSCSAILKSDAAKIGGWISWSEIGFIYFAGGLIALLFSGLNTPSLFLIAWLNVLALPYTVFSVYYQWKVARRWCVLCLSVQAILLTEFIVALLGRMHTLQSVMEVPANVVGMVALSFVIPATAWYLLKPSLLLAKESSKAKLELARLKHNPQIFEALLGKQKSIVHNPEGLGVTLGDSGAKNKIIKVCNPYCGPCASAHPAIEELLHHNSDIQVQMIFTATNEEGDIKAPPVKHFLALAEKNDPQLLEQALDDWYHAPVKDYESFATKHKLNGELQQQGEKLQAMHDWCQKTEITFTPTFFVNGHQLPAIYSVKDLQYFLSV